LVETEDCLLRLTERTF